MVKDSNLRGRGGAASPTGMKWQFIPQPKKGEPSKPHYVVVNADESEPGTCRDLPLMMNDPHSMLEGIIIACYAVRAEHAFIYIRGEAIHAIRPGPPRRSPRPRPRATSAPTSSTPGSAAASPCTAAPAPTSAAKRPPCSTRSRAGAASPASSRRSRPRTGSTTPRPSSTTPAAWPAVPYIVLGGADWFKKMGPEGSPGPCIYSLSGRVKNPPGQYERPWAPRCANCSSWPAA